VTFDHIRKFFRGLSPERIFILPNLGMTIHNFDSVEEDDTKPLVNRHPNCFRVFVKFESYPVAHAAIERTGETIYVENLPNGGESTRDSIGAAISITSVSKKIATHIQKYMAIEGMKGMTLEETLSDTEEKIPHIVNQILWVMARHKLGLNVIISKIGGGDYSTILVNHLESAFAPLNTNEYRKIAILYNKLWDIHEKLINQCMPTQLYQFDPSIVDLEPAQHLTSVASDWLLDQMDMLENCLAHYRTRRNLNRKDD